MRHALVFLAVALADALWSRYIIAASAGQAFPAASYSAAILVVGAFVTLSWIEKRIYLIPAALGAFIGTYLAVLLG